MALPILLLHGITFEVLELPLSQSESMRMISRGRPTETHCKEHSGGERR